MSWGLPSALTRSRAGRRFPAASGGDATTARRRTPPLSNDVYSMWTPSARSSGAPPASSVRVDSVPARATASRISSPAWRGRSAVRSSLSLEIGSPSMLRMTSPSRSPAASAGPPGRTRFTTSPPSTCRLSASAAVRARYPIPRNARRGRSSERAVPGGSARSPAISSGNSARNGICGHLLIRRRPPSRSDPRLARVSRAHPGGSGRAVPSILPRASRARGAADRRGGPIGGSATGGQHGCVPPARRARIREAVGPSSTASSPLLLRLLRVRWRWRRLAGCTASEVLIRAINRIQARSPEIVR